MAPLEPPTCLVYDPHGCRQAGIFEPPPPDEEAVATTLGLLLNCINSGLYMANYNLARILPPCKSDSLGTHALPLLASCTVSFAMLCQQLQVSTCRPMLPSAHLNATLSSICLTLLTNGLWHPCEQRFCNVSSS